MQGPEFSDTRFNPPSKEQVLKDSLTRGLGALPPPEMAWQMGKTAASIAFVNTAAPYLTSRNRILHTLVEKIKKGEIILHAFLEPTLFAQTTETLEEAEKMEQDFIELQRLNERAD